LDPIKKKRKSDGKPDRKDCILHSEAIGSEGGSVQNPASSLTSSGEERGEAYLYWIKTLKNSFVSLKKIPSPSPRWRKREIRQKEKTGRRLFSR